MANSQADLPEGTDSIISGASVLGDDGYRSDTFPASGTGIGGGTTAGDKLDAAADKADDAAAKVGDVAAGLREQATEKAYGYAAQGKERAVGLLDNVTRLVDDAAGQIDEKAGEQFGNYARQASQAVAGLADSLRDKDIDVLLDEARELVRKSPAIAIGAAAAAGFLISRVLKAGITEGEVVASRVVNDTGTVSTGTTRPTPTTAATVAVDPVY